MSTRPEAMIDDKFWQRFNEIREENIKKAKADQQKPKKVDPWMAMIQELDVNIPGMIGLQLSPKLSSQQQMKARKICDRFADTMLIVSDPTVNEKLASEIYFKGLKQRMMDKMKDEDTILVPCPTCKGDPTQCGCNKTINAEGNSLVT